MFGSRVGFSWTADRMALFPVSQNPPSWKILNGHISAMSYPIHFHELQSEEYRRKCARSNYIGHNLKYFLCFYIYRIEEYWEPKTDGMDRLVIA